MLMKPYDHAIVLDQIKRLLACSGEPRRELIGHQGRRGLLKHPGTALPLSLWRRKSDLLLLTARALTQRSTAQSVSGTRQF